MFHPFRLVILWLILASTQLVGAAGIARAQTAPGWYLTGTGNGPAIAHAGPSGEDLTLACAVGSLMMTSVHLVPDLPARLRNDWNAAERTIFLQLESTARLRPDLKIGARLLPGRDVKIKVTLNTVPDLTANDPEAALTFRADAHNGEILGTITAAGLQSPLTELLRVCSAYPASPGAPSFDCTASPLTRFGEREICGDPQAAELDGRILARYLQVTAGRAPVARAQAWTGYRRWTEDRLACGRDMACVIDRGQAYLAELGTEISPDRQSPEPSAALARLRDPQGLLDEAARHGIPAPGLHAIIGRTAYITPGCASGCAANVYAIHDIGPDEAVPLDMAADLAALADIGPLYGSELKLNHLRLGHPLPERFAEGGLPAISRAVARFDSTERAKWSISPEPRTWAEELADRKGIALDTALRAKAAERQRLADLAAHFAQETVRHERLTAAGHVYRAPDYWTDFFYPLTIRDLFEGRRFDPDSAALRQSVAGFVIGFNRHCSTHMPADAVPFTRTQMSRVLNGYGIELSRLTSTRTSRVHKELAPYFAEMTRNGPTATDVTTALGTVDELLSGRFDSRTVVGPLVGNALDAQRLVASHDCRGPAVAQLLGNLAANTNGTPMPIQAGVAIPGAGRESDAPPDPDRASSIVDACMRAGGYAMESAPRCSCAEAEVAPAMDRTQRQAALQDFRAVAETLFIGGSDAQTPAGRAYQACVRRTAR